METFSALLAICAGNSPAPGEFPTQRPVTRSFYVFFDLHPNKRLSKQWWGWWFEMQSRPLWRQCNEMPDHCPGELHIPFVNSHDGVMKWKHFPRYWPVGEIHRSPVNSSHKDPVTRSFYVFFDLHPNKRLSKQWWGWWFEMQSRPLWRQCNEMPDHCPGELHIPFVNSHDGVMKWKHFPRYWPVGEIHRSPVNSLHKDPVTWSFDVFLIYAWINGWVVGLVIWDTIALITTSL